MSGGGEHGRLRRRGRRWESEAERRRLEAFHAANLAHPLPLGTAERLAAKIYDLIITDEGLPWTGAGVHAVAEALAMVAAKVIGQTSRPDWALESFEAAVRVAAKKNPPPERGTG